MIGISYNTNRLSICVDAQALSANIEVSNGWVSGLREQFSEVKRNEVVKSRCGKVER
jgi:hypothetical protein